MASTGSDNEPESILDNLSKTRQLWSSKADIGSLDYLIPKSPVSTNQTFKEVQANNIPSTDIVRSEDQVEEEYELPDIKSMKSQFESPNSKIVPPLPTPKSPATRTQSQTTLTNDVAPIVVNREETEEEEYSVELGALKEKFESAAKSTNYQRPKSPKSPISKSSIKEHVNRVRSSKSQLGDAPGRKTGKKIRFQDEQARKKHPEHFDNKPTEVAVDLSSIKSQFENRHDQHLMSPVASPQTKKTKQESNSSTPRGTVEVDGPEVVRPSQMEEEEHFSVEMNELKKKFEYSSNNSTPRRLSFKQSAKSPQVDTPVKERKHSDRSSISEDTPRVETVKSSEPVYDQMTGEESVKDKLQRFKELSSKNGPKITVRRRISQKKIASTPVVLNEDITPVAETTETDVVRSDPAGTPITPDYVPSIDLQQTKALFGGSKPAKRSSISRSHSSSSKGGDSITQSPTRTGRSPVPSSRSRNSSSHRSSVSSRSPDSAATPRTRTTSSNPADDVTSQSDDMADIVRPPPAGTKETADYVPSVKVSSMKNMWETPKKEDSQTSAGPPKRRVLKEDWSNGNGEEEVPKTAVDGGSQSARKVVADGSYEDRGGIVRPHTAGTKELPGYNLSSDFLKSRAAMFSGNNKDEYKPKNKIQNNKTNTAEIVNSADKQEEESYSINLKGTKQMFESGGPPVTPKQAERTTTEIRETPTGEIVRPPPAGTREDSDIVPASNLSSMKKMFDGSASNEKPVDNGRKEMIDIKQEANEVVQRDREIQSEKQQAPEPAAEEPAAEEPVAEEPAAEEPAAEEPAAADTESESEGEYVLEEQKQPEEPVVEQQPQQAEEVKQEEEAAAVVPVRVAIPDEPVQEEEQPADPSDNEEHQAGEAAAVSQEPEVVNDDVEQNDAVGQDEPVADDVTTPQENDDVTQKSEDEPAQAVDEAQHNNVDDAASYDNDVTEQTPVKNQAPTENGVAQDDAPVYLE